MQGPTLHKIKCKSKKDKKKDHIPLWQRIIENIFKRRPTIQPIFALLLMIGLCVLPRFIDAILSR